MGREKNLSVGQFSIVCLCAVGLILPVSTMWSRAETVPAKSAELKYQEIPVSLISETSQLTFAGDKAGEGYFSQDGKKMIFQSERPLPADLQKKGPNPFYQIYLMDLKSGKTELVSPGMGKTTCSWIHPDLKRALFSSTHLDPQFPEKVKAELEQRRNPVKKGYAWSFDDQYDIFSVDLRTKKLTQLTHESGYDAEASYSPDGKWIVFASNRAGYDPQQLAKLSAEDRALFAKDPSYLMDLYLMAADGTHVQQLTTTLGYDGGPFFSSDGKKITWRRFSPNGAQAEIMTMDLATKVEKQVTSLGAMSWAPFFHPSGDYIVFTSSVLGYSNFELFAVDVEGKHLPIRVTKWEGFDGLPVFTPDGKKLSWTHRAENGESQIYWADWDDAAIREQLGLTIGAPKTVPALADADLRGWVRYFAQESMAGRGTGSDAEKLFHEVIKKKWQEWGLEVQEQKFQFKKSVQAGDKTTLSLNNKTSKILTDYVPLSFGMNGEFNASEIVFAGYGLKVSATEAQKEYDSYRDLDVKDKWVLVLDDVPQDVGPERRHFLSAFSGNQHKLSVAKNLGAKGVIFVRGPQSGTDADVSKMRLEGSSAISSVFALRMSQNLAVQLFHEAGHDLGPLQIRLDHGENLKNDEQFTLKVKLEGKIALVFENGEATNLIGVLKAPQKGPRAQTIAIGAHGDHLSRGEWGSSLAVGMEKGKIHYGADDNASGMAAVMELAEYWASHRKQLKRNLQFVIWSGEEMGLLGSHHYAKTVTGKDLPMAYINMDMIGRLKDRLLFQGAGSGDIWMNLVEETSLQTGLSIGTQKDPYLPTDSMALYMAQVPSISLFTGSHGEYHTPRDRAYLINYAGLLRVTEFVGTLTQKLADNQSITVRYQKAGSGPKEMNGRQFKIFLGTIPDYTSEGIKGLKISGTSPQSPAEKSGLLPDDVIVELDRAKIENIYDYVYAMQGLKPLKEVELKIMRKGQQSTLKITPVLKE